MHGSILGLLANQPLGLNPSGSVSDGLPLIVKASSWISLWLATTTISVLLFSPSIPVGVANYTSAFVGLGLGFNPSTGSLACLQEMAGSSSAYSTVREY